MGVIQYPTQIPATVGTLPPLKMMITTDSLATLTTAGYLNNANLDAAAPLSNGDVIMCLYSYNTTTKNGTLGIFTVSISGASGSISLTSWANPGDVLLPVVADHIAQFNGTTGQIYDGGLAASSLPTFTSPTIANHLAVYTNTSGNLGEDAATAINAGNIQAGLSGTAGSVISFPAGALAGSLALKAIGNTGDTVTTISNAIMGQASTISIPDPGAAAANFVLDTGTTNMITGSQINLAKANGTEAANAVTASGNAGVITTSSLTTVGGGTYAITWTNTHITATSVIGLTIQGGTNNATNNITFTCVPGAGTATLTIFNNTAATALNGTLLIGYSVL